MAQPVGAQQESSVHALDYLVKPVHKARFAEALERMRETRHSVNAYDLSQRLSALIETQEKERLKQRIVVPTVSGRLVINPYLSIQVLALACQRDAVDSVSSSSLSSCLRLSNRPFMITA